MKKIVSMCMLTGLFSCGNSQQGPTIAADENAVIVDVRTIGEWQDGHADCSVNYPLNEFGNHIEELKKYDKVIVVCRSGNRAGTAKKMLESAGFKNVENKGSWKNVKCS